MWAYIGSPDDDTVIHLNESLGSWIVTVQKGDKPDTLKKSFENEKAARAWASAEYGVTDWKNSWLLDRLQGSDRVS